MKNCLIVLGLMMAAVLLLGGKQAEGQQVKPPSLLSALIFDTKSGILAVYVYSPANSSIATNWYQVSVILNGVTAGSQFVASYDPTIQAFYVWAGSYNFLQIGALNGVVLAHVSYTSPQSVVAACPSSFGANSLVFVSTSGSNIALSTANDQGTSQQALGTFPSYAGTSLTASPLCATGAVGPSLFYPFSFSSPNYPSALYYLAAGAKSTPVRINSDHMTLINSLASYTGPFDQQPEADRAIYVLGLQTSIPIRVVSVSQGNVTSTVTLPITVPQYQTRYAFTNSFLRSPAAFLPQTSTYIFPLLNLKSSTVTYMMSNVASSSTPSTAFPFDTTTPVFGVSTQLLAIAAFP